MGKYLGWGKLKDNGKVWQPCAETKSKQQSVPQARRAPRLTIPNERLYRDLATVNTPTDATEKVSKPHRQLIVDEETGIQNSTFHQNKDTVLDDISA
jgi:hypothetical protein